MLLLLLLTYLTPCYSQSCELPDWYCEATGQCVAYNQTCDGTCYIYESYYDTYRERDDGPGVSGRPSGLIPGPFLYNNDIYYCGLTDTCNHAEDPCGDYCHPRKYTIPTLGYPYDYAEKNLCEIDQKCYEGRSDENIACRSKINNCSDSEHYCKEAGGCQENSKTCNDYCSEDDSWDYFQDSYGYPCELQCLAKDHTYCDILQKCINTPCTSGCDNGQWLCTTTQTCIPLSQTCNGACVDYSSYTDPEYLRYFCEDEGECKTYSELCGEKCYNGYFYCGQTQSCIPKSSSNYNDCGDGCKKGEAYCRETGSCSTLSKPCYGECLFGFGKDSLSSYPQQLLYCTASNSCTNGEVPCKGTCLANSRPDLCEEIDVCYSGNRQDSARQKCFHIQANCTEDEWLCKKEGCIPLSQPCRSNRPMSKYRNNTCVETYRGKKYSKVLCEETNTCLHKFTPCNGSCSDSYPRLRYCEATNTCVNIAKPCGGACLLQNRFKCKRGEKCIHKSLVNDGKFDCKDKSDEDIKDEEDERRAIYKLLKLLNITI